MIFFKQASVQWKLDDWSFKRRLTIGGIQTSKGRRLVRFEFEARRGTIGGIQISEGLRLVGFTIPFFVPRIQRSSGNTGKTREIIPLSFPVSGSRLPVTSLPVIQLPVMQLPVTSYSVTSLLPTAPPQMISGWCLYTTDICNHCLLTLKL